MGFSNGVFQPAGRKLSLSHDTMDHAKLVMACRFGWAAGPVADNEVARAPAASQASTASAPVSTYVSKPTTSRFAPCRGRLYHQLICSHRVRTDIVEDCGPNCVEPYNTACRVPFYCHECVDQQAKQIWLERENQHNACYPAIDQMSKDQYDRWYDEHRRLEAQFSKDRAVYERELMANSRLSNVCSAAEATQEEVSFAAEMDALTIAMESSSGSTVGAVPRAPRVERSSLPYDPSEQLHWDLNSLALERGPCGLEYSAQKSLSAVSTTATVFNEDIWLKPRA